MTVNSDYACKLGALPLYSPEDVIGLRNVLVVAPHPDDESLGCGGLLAWAAATGRDARVLFLTDGEGSHPGSLDYPRARLAATRVAEATAACAHLGLRADQLTFLHHPDQALEPLKACEKIARQVREWASALAPCVVCVTAATDPHADHQAANAIVTRALHNASGVQLFSYPVWSWLLPAGDNIAAPRGRRIDVSAFRPAKRRAIDAHASQHGCVVVDDTAAFTLPANLLQRIDRNDEVLLDDLV